MPTSFLSAGSGPKVRKTVGIDLGTTNSVIALLDAADSTLLTGRRRTGPHDLSVRARLARRPGAARGRPAGARPQGAGAVRDGRHAAAVVGQALHGPGQAIRARPRDADAAAGVGRHSAVSARADGPHPQRPEIPARLGRHHHAGLLQPQPDRGHAPGRRAGRLRGRGAAARADGGGHLLFLGREPRRCGLPRLRPGRRHLRRVGHPPPARRLRGAERQRRPLPRRRRLRPPAGHAPDRTRRSGPSRERAGNPRPYRPPTATHQPPSSTRPRRRAPSISAGWFTSRRGSRSP